jgi:hypothetical protein
MYSIGIIWITGIIWIVWIICLYNIMVYIYGESPKWMVYNGKSRNITDDLGVPP